mgnify:CR=1 FL=1|tara:strand:+ start:158 stop:580 length:423 start_codon:yes stop_codon:yes gene_type:complete
MENKYKIIISYIQDLSIEIPTPENLLTIRNTIPEFQMKVDINSKPLKKKMIEVVTTLSYTNPNKKKLTGFFQIKYATVIDIIDLKIRKDELEKIVLSDLQTRIYPELEKKFLTILKNSGLPDLKFGKKIDFEELYKARLN